MVAVLFAEPTATELVALRESSVLSVCPCTADRRRTPNSRSSSRRTLITSLDTLDIRNSWNQLVKFEEVVYDVLTSTMLSSHGSVASLDGFASLDTNAYNLYNMCAYYSGCLDFYKDTNRKQQKQRVNEIAYNA